jgi:hypothetical protein
MLCLFTTLASWFDCCITWFIGGDCILYIIKSCGGEKMKRKQAIKYLQEKDMIQQNEVTEPKFSKEDEYEINKVMKKGKIYGDPIAEIQW